jgi:hypothetical protein
MGGFEEKGFEVFEEEGSVKAWLICNLEQETRMIRWQREDGKVGGLRNESSCC